MFPEVANSVIQADEAKKSPSRFATKLISLAESWGNSQGERNKGEGWLNER